MKSFQQGRGRSLVLAAATALLLLLSFECSPVNGWSVSYYASSSSSSKRTRNLRMLATATDNNDDDIAPTKVSKVVKTTPLVVNNKDDDSVSNAALEKKILAADGKDDDDDDNVFPTASSAGSTSGKNTNTNKATNTATTTTTTTTTTNATKHIYYPQAWNSTGQENKTSDMTPFLDDDGIHGFASTVTYNDPLTSLNGDPLINNNTNNATFVPKEKVSPPSKWPLAVVIIFLLAAVGLCVATAYKIRKRSGYQAVATTSLVV